MTSEPRGLDADHGSSVWKGPVRRVLVLDDDQLVIRAVSRTLRRAGLEVHGTCDGVDALEIAKAEAPHAVVSDLHMPAACGAAFLTSIAGIVPTAIRVLMSADPEFLPRVGSLAAAKVHAMIAKTELSRLAAVIVEQLRGRSESPANGEDREALARRVAKVLWRPGHEDEGHRERVTRWTSTIAAAMGLAPEEIEAARLGAILHDVGQVALRDHIFTRKGPLNAEEREELAGHPAAGARIIEEMPALKAALPVITAHHERPDGGGYPNRLRSAAIPRSVRAFQVADAYDAMTHGRPYATRRSHRDALDVLAAGAGRQHDAEAVRALASIDEAVLHHSPADS
jgi:putative two-component system response regulator